ncbi:hypothetical protein GGI21_000762 [Coemansia aciculifera]|uniref:Uncharacterized protein n=1 Tax=Coemansia aciculifera TaxID=417176 RepID=A0ACC1M707_9FUNG|nr:hypothetical protein IWW38_001496 [Coemansia aciculifera]KAJ2910547.1 hypothetical protein GGI21_000762 [Coemansia aciculifera]
MVELSAHLPSGQDTAEDKTNLWETALKEAGQSKTVATKHVLVLGDSNSGKTGVVAQLFNASFHPQVGNGLNTTQQSSTSMGFGSSSGHAAVESSATEVDSVVALSKHDLALSYSYMDVRDEDNEETLARLGIYQLASDRVSDRDLLKFVLDARTFGSSAAIIVLDWSKPWRFVKTLLRWVNVLSGAVDMVCRDTGGRESAKGAGGWTLGKAAVDESRERLERFLQEYSETTDAHSAAGASAIVASAAAATTDDGGGAGLSAKTTAGVLLPLGQGVLETNFGLPLIVVCTKSDTMELIERERGFKEEDFDYIQQVLRAVCLQFGAALIYTSTHNPVTFSTLYHYLVHRLLTTPATMPALGADSGQLPDTSDGLDDGNHNADMDNGDAGNRVRSGSTARDLGQSSKSAIEYPFRVRANVVDRDVVFVPSGWDSVTKICYLREPFDVFAIQDAWQVDEGRYRAIVDRAIAFATSAQPGAANNFQDEQQSEIPDNSLLLMFSELVASPKQHAGITADGGSTAAVVAMAAAGMASRVVVEDDQVFFERLFNEQQEEMALEGEEAGESASNIYVSDSYADSGRPRAGGPANKLMASFMRGGPVAESSLSTASAEADTIGDDISDDGHDGHDTSFVPSTHLHARSESSDVGRGSLGRATTEYRSSRPTQQQQPPTDSVAAASSLRRKLTLPATSTAAATAGNSGEAAAGSATNEDLTSFFQNLLGRKGGATSSATSSNGRSSPQQPPRALGGSLSRATGGGGQKEDQASLDRWRAQLKRQKE